MRRIAARTPGASLDEIERVYRARAVDFERVAAAIVRDREVARDVVQDAFAAVVRKRRGFARRGPLDAWVWRAVVNTALNHLASDRRRNDRVLQLSPDSGEPEQARDADIRAALAALPERQRLVVFLRYYADLDYEEIAHTLSISPGTVGKLLHDARTSIGRAIGTEPGE